MNKAKRNFILGLGAIVAVAAPVVAVVSCGSDNPHPNADVNREDKGNAYWDGKANHLSGKDYRYQIGSTTKMFTAMSVFKLIQDKKQVNGKAFALDSKMSDVFDQAYIDQFKGLSNKGGSLHFADLTVKQLITHKAGLPDFLNLLDDAGHQKHDADTFKIVKDEMAGHVDLKKIIDFTIKHNNNRWPAAGTVEYSNMGFYVLGDVIAKVSGKSYQDFVATEIFNKLGMTHSNFNYGDLNPRLGKQSATFIDSSLYYSAGGIASSLTDMITFGKEIQGGHKVLNATSLTSWKTLAKDANNKFGAGLMYASGLFTHPGQTLGYISGFVVNTKYIYVAEINDAAGDDGVAELVQAYPQV